MILWALISAARVHVAGGDPEVLSGIDIIVSPTGSFGVSVLDHLKKWKDNAFVGNTGDFDTSSHCHCWCQTLPLRRSIIPAQWPTSSRTEHRDCWRQLLFQD